MKLSEWDFDAVAEINRQTLKDLADGASTEYWSAQKYVLIGPNHPQGYYELFEEEGATFYHGTVTIEKGGLTDPGSLTFSGVGGGRGELEEHISGFSKKRVLYS
ncbi:MAG: hypothetical protein KGQ66_05990 [Acidobacteriota bacterium]|nr:hypothetical protein [Acidobacteriota bacterium]